MKATHLSTASLFHDHGFTRRARKCNQIANSNFLPVSYVGDCHLSANTASATTISPFITRRPKPRSPVVANHLSSDPCLGSADVDQALPLQEQTLLTTSDKDTVQLPATRVNEKPYSDVKRELLLLSLPALAGQAIDPLAQLMETAYIGRLGTVELASAGVSVTIFNIISKLFNIPLLSVTTSFVAEDIAKIANQDSASEHGGLENSGNGKPLKRVSQRKQLSSVSTALLLALGIGIFEALAMYLGSGTFLHVIGVSTENPTYIPAQQYLSLRAVGAPAVVLSLALQGIFRGFKDTKTPVLCIGIGNLSAVFLFPLLMYSFQLGITGAAISTVLSQYIVTLLMIWCLNKQAELLPPKMGDLQFGSYIKSGGFLLGRTLAVLSTMTLGTSMAARQGPVAMAAHQICMQVWLAVSLLTDALAASSQALIASSLSRHEYKVVKEITNFVLRIGLLTGICLTAILGASFGSLATLFTQDYEVLQVVRTGVLFVSASQPFNALAYIFDGLHYGVSDFPYAAFSMMFVGAVSSAFLIFAPSHFGLHGVWLGLTLFMALRVVAGFVRLLSKSGPWWFLHRNLQIAEENGTRPEFQLACEGVNQAQLAGKLFLKELETYNIPLANVRICYSPFSRTKHTAKVVADVLNLPFEVPQCKMMEDLRERFFGPSFELLSHDKYAEIWDLDEKDPLVGPEGGESVKDVACRIARAMAIMESEFEGCAILVVSHGDSLQILQTILNAANQHKEPTYNDLASRLEAVQVAPILSQHRKYALLTGELRGVI